MNKKRLLTLMGGWKTFDITYTPTTTTVVDTYLRSDNTTGNYETATSIFIGGSNTSTNVYRSLFKFDLSGIPTKSKIVSATLSLYVDGDYSNNEIIIRVYRLKRNVIYTQATWNSYATGSDWATAGGFGADDCEQTDIGSRTMSATEANGYKDFELTPAAVEAWIAGTFTNNGFFLKADTETDDAYRVTTENNETTAQHPKLRIVYKAPF